MNKFKCIIWDLDNTLWNGILIEKKDVIISEEMISIIHELDKRGIIQSIASRNNFENVNRILTKYNIEKFFLYPQINWSPKSESLKKISENLHISYESMVLIDDDTPYYTMIIREDGHKIKLLLDLNEELLHAMKTQYPEKVYFA